MEGKNHIISTAKIDKILSDTWYYNIKKIGTILD